jgi:hypothetical protein
VTVLDVVLLVTVAGLLTVSALAKALQPRLAAAALVDLGVPPRLARASVFAVVVLEGVVAAALVVWPKRLEAQAACVAVFFGFALVGALALHTGRVVDCGCFGALHRSTLGWTQILQFAVVAPSVLVTGRWAPLWDERTGLSLVTLVLVAVSTGLVAYLAPMWWRIRRERSSYDRVREYVRRARLPAAHVTERAGERT